MTAFTKLVIVGVLGFLLSGAASAQCPALTGPGNFPHNVTVYVYGVFDTGYGWPDVYSPAAALQAWSDTTGAGITVTPLLFGGPPSGPYGVMVMWYPTYFVYGASIRTSYSAAGSSVMLVDNSGTRILSPELYAHEAGHSFGLDDCVGGNCATWVTIMQGNIDADSATSPLPCD